MAVRHEVENLIRRGNIFYWRPRVPRTFRKCRPDARLSLSLGATDHRKAQYLARRLNTRLAELKHGPTAGMTTKDQLAKLFAEERDSMNEHLENIALVSRRNGRPDDISGRLSEGDTNTRYTAPAEVPLMRDAMAKYPIITEALQPQPIRLLPWVAEKLPPPWAREGLSETSREQW